MPKNLYFRVIVCSRCGKGGGTLQKAGKDNYVHKECPPLNKEEILSLRRKQT